ncbi:GGDEF domain-containing phosphodiesterase [Neisseriaceae bacterium TC5R-5]|nr:GGDEF domain-containing phosphodiesterase [Neisseriaceae bacterium TC5R-5]
MPNRVSLNFSETLASALIPQINILPIYILQAIGLIGLVSTILIFYGSRVFSFGQSKKLGLIFGLASFMLAAIMSQWMGGTFKPYLRHDMLFLAGFFGGWINATITILFTCAARIFFGGTVNALPASIDIMLVAYGSVLLRKLINKPDIESISNSDVFNILCWRMIVFLIPVSVYYFYDTIDQKKIIINSIYLLITSNFTISIFIVYAIVFLIRREIIREKSLYFDNLTSLPNHRSLQQHLTDKFKQSRSSATPIPQALILVSIDNFLELVQENAHDWADDFFQKLSSYLQNTMQTPLLQTYQPMVYYFSDSSLAIILNHTSMSEARDCQLVERLHAELLEMENVNNSSLSIRFDIKAIDIQFNNSFSPSWFLRTINSLENNWRPGIHYFEADITKQIQLESHLRSRIEHWINDGDIPLWLQPKVDLIKNHCIGAEALLRVNDSTSRSAYIPPGYVLSIARKHHLLESLELACIKSIIEKLGQLPEKFQSLVFSVNLSTFLLNNTKLSHYIIDLLKHNKVPGKNLVLEITETNQLINSEIVQDNVSALIDYGVTLSLDDFGTGYSSLALLAELPFGELKIDYLMVSRLEHPRTLAAISLAIDGGKRYQAKMVAEGIENEKQRQQLIAMGISYGQGFLFARAMPFSDFLQYAEDHLAPATASTLDDLNLYA